MPFLYLGAALFFIVLVIFTFVLVCLVRNASHLEQKEKDEEQEAFIKHYKL